MSKQDSILRNQKQGSFINEKIVDLNDEVHSKIKVLDRLLGNFRDADQFKGDYLKMLVSNNKGE